MTKNDKKIYTNYHREIQDIISGLNDFSCKRFLYRAARINKGQKIVNAKIEKLMKSLRKNFQQDNWGKERQKSMIVMKIIADFFSKYKLRLRTHCNTCMMLKSSMSLYKSFV